MPTTSSRADAARARRLGEEVGADEAPTARPATSLFEPRLVLVGVIGGVLSGLLGVGGGIVMVPLLTLWVGIDQRSAHALSLGAVIPISLGGIATYGVAGEVHWIEAALLALGAVAGAQVGAGVLARIDEAMLKACFGTVLMVVSVLVVVT